MKLPTRRDFIERTAALTGSLGYAASCGRLFAAEEKQIGSDAFERLRSKLKGRLVLPGDSAYESARRVFYWNPRTERIPAAIVQCGHEEDVVRAVEFARHHELEVAVRAGGHSHLGVGQFQRPCHRSFPAQTNQHRCRSSHRARAGRRPERGSRACCRPARPRPRSGPMPGRGRHRPHARRRAWLALGTLRRLLRQPPFRAAHHRRCAHAGCERRDRSRSLLGPPRCRRKLRRHDILRSQAPSHRPGRCRRHPLRRSRRTRRPARLPRTHARGARWIPGDAQPDPGRTRHLPQPLSRRRRKRGGKDSSNTPLDCVSDQRSGATPALRHPRREGRRDQSGQHPTAGVPRHSNRLPRPRHRRDHRHLSSINSPTLRPIRSWASATTCTARSAG